MSQGFSDLLPGTREDVPLDRFSTFRLGGPARYLFEAKTIAAYTRGIALARREQLPWRVIGAGSNLLVSAAGFAGLVIVARMDHSSFDGQTVTAEAGVKLAVLLVLAAQKNLGGLDGLAGVPGTVGGALYGNAGSRTWGIGDVVKNVTVLDDQGQTVTLAKKDCAFAYRSSRFKQTQEPILSAQLLPPTVDGQAALRSYAAKIQQKNRSQPTSDQSAGCIFKNVTVREPASLPKELQPHVVDGQLSAWRLLAAAGLQGKQIGGARVSDRHANFIVNTGQATVDDVVILISYIKQQVRDRFGIQLEEEVQYLGFD